jgi:hypothetical protein
MPMAQKGKAKRKEPREKPAKEAGGSVVVCALCQEVMHPTAEKVDTEVIIYSVCPPCKLSPARY